MKDTQFGASDAAKTLVRILQSRDDRNLTRRVSSSLGYYFRGVREIAASSLTTQIKRAVLRSWKEGCVERIYANYDREVANFMNNVVVGKYREIYAIS